MLKVACLVLADSEGFVFASQRPSHKPLGGLWEFPGGKVETGESPEEALRREIWEELRFVPDDLEALALVAHEYEFGAIQLLPFLSRCEKRPVVQLVEHTDYRWVSPDGFAALEWAPADVPILGEVTALLRGV